MVGFFFIRNSGDSDSSLCEARWHLWNYSGRKPSANVADYASVYYSMSSIMGWATRSFKLVSNKIEDLVVLLMRSFSFQCLCWLRSTHLFSPISGAGLFAFLVSSNTLPLWLFWAIYYFPVTVPQLWLSCLPASCVALVRCNNQDSFLVCWSLLLI